MLLITLAFQAAYLYQNRMLTKLSDETNEKQQEALTEITGNVMQSVVDTSMSRTTDLEAMIASEVFRNLSVRVEMLGEYALSLFENPDSVGRAAYKEPDPADNGEVIAQLIMADGADEEAISDKIGLVANMSEMMISLFGASAETNSCFIALPEGAFLVVDDRSATKYSESGAPVSYDPRLRPWYQQAVEKGTLIFTDVEIDAFTGDVGIVCAMPVYLDGQLQAVVGSDLFLTSMQQAIENSDGDGGFNVVVNNNGHVVFSPKTEGIFQVRSSDTAVDLRQGTNAELSSLINDAMEGSTGVRLVNLDDGEYYMAGAPMDLVGWTLLYAFSKEVTDQPSVMLRDSYRSIQEEAALTYTSKMKTSRTTMMVLLLVLIAAMAAGALTLGKRIVRPLNTITKRIASLSETNLEFKMEDEYRTDDEIEVLAESFAKLSHRTVQYVDEVRRVTAEKERIGTELHMANQIQESMLPSIFPAFPERSELCMVIADVSGKGVPAALFMMISKIIIQSCAMLGRGAGEILTKTNEALCSNNRMEMFVTVWLGILEISTGKLTAANAGHEYPAIMRKGKFELLKDKHGLVIGGMAGIEYKEYELMFKPGDKRFLYTDGVAEATRKDNTLFGTGRMIDALNINPDADPQELLTNVRNAVDEFVGESEQFDDLTMMCFEYKGGSGDQS